MSDRRSPVAANPPEAVASVIAELEAAEPNIGEGETISDEPPAEAEVAAEPEGDPDGPGIEVLSNSEEEGEEAPAAPVVVPVAKEDPAIARSLAALARKEALLRDRERQLADRERSMTFTADQLTALRAQATQDPVAFYKALGIDKTDEIAAQLYYEILPPDKQPPEWRTKKEALATQRQVADLRRQLEEKNIQEVKMRQESAARSFLVNKVSAIPEDFKYLKLEAQENPHVIADEMFRKVQDLGARGQLYGLNDDQIAHVVAQAMDEELKASVTRYERIYQKANPASAPKTASAATPPKPVTSKKVLNSSPTRPQPPPPTDRKSQIANVLRELRAGKAKG